VSLSGLWLDLCLTKVPPNPKISKIVWENSQTPAPYSQDDHGNASPPDRICSLTSSLICKNPHGHSWSVAGTVCLYGSPKPNDHGNASPPDRMCSLTSSLIWKNPHGHSWSVAGTVCLYGSPKPKNLEICVGKLPNSCNKYPRSPWINSST